MHSLDATNQKFIEELVSRTIASNNQERFEVQLARLDSDAREAARKFDQLDGDVAAMDEEFRDAQKQIKALQEQGIRHDERINSHADKLTETENDIGNQRGEIGNVQGRLTAVEAAVSDKPGEGKVYAIAIGVMAILGLAIAVIGAFVPDRTGAAVAAVEPEAAKGAGTEAVGVEASAAPASGGPEG